MICKKLQTHRHDPLTPCIDPTLQRPGLTTIYTPAEEPSSEGPVLLLVHRGRVLFWSGLLRQRAETEHRGSGAAAASNKETEFYNQLRQSIC